MNRQAIKLKETVILRHNPTAMIFVYNMLVILASQLLKIAAYFSKKLRMFVDGRRQVFEVLREKISPDDKVIWVHAASLGEYEQGLPVMEQLKEVYPDHKILLTFFSPSGYEVRKNNTIADVTVYLPLDTKAHARRFMHLAHPKMALFIKYEFWPNYLEALKGQQVPTYLISGIFRKDQVFFKWYGGFYRNALKAFSYFFVQNDSSRTLVESLGYSNVAVSGDTRFDRVAAILEKDNRLDFMERFVDGQMTVVIGSSWPKDEELLVPYINESAPDIKFVIAPHNIKEGAILRLKDGITRKAVLYSDHDPEALGEAQVLIVDTIGLLTKIYSYADIAYVGGGFGNPGVHNILEPATFGVPIVIGPNYSHFAEATALTNMGGCVPISNGNQLAVVIDQLISNEDIRHEKGHICSTFVQMNKNATQKILQKLGSI